MYQIPHCRYSCSGQDIGCSACISVTSCTGTLKTNCGYPAFSQLPVTVRCVSPIRCGIGYDTAGRIICRWHHIRIARTWVTGKPPQAPGSGFRYPHVMQAHRVKPVSLPAGQPPLRKSSNVLSCCPCSCCHYNMQVYSV